MRPCRLTGQDRGNPVVSMRRPRAGLVTSPPGGPGQPSAGIMTGCLEWLHVDDDEGAMATAPDEVRIEDSVVARKRGSGGHKTPLK